MEAKEYFGLQNLRGLKNFQNSCWFNSVLQCLAQSPWFYEQLHRYLSDDDDDCVDISGGTVTINGEASTYPDIKIELNEAGILTFCLYKTFRILGNGSESSLFPKVLLRNVVTTLSQFPLGEYHDAHEFVNCLIETLNSEHEARYRIAIRESLETMKKTNAQLYATEDQKRELSNFYCSQAARMFRSPVETPFRGSLRNILQCMDCKTVTHRDELIFDLSIPIAESNCSEHEDVEAILEERRKFRRDRFLKSIVESNYSKLLKGEFDTRVSLAVCYRQLLDEFDEENKKADFSTEESDSESDESGKSLNMEITDLPTDVSSMGESSQIRPELEIGIEAVYQEIEEDQTGNEIRNSEEIDFGDLNLDETLIDDCFEESLESEEIPFETMKEDRCYLKKCLDQFFSQEVLSGDNRVVCGECTKRSGSTDQKTDTTKQLLLSRLPNIFILHLKRFDLVAGAVAKNNVHVDFPNVLDMSTYCTDQLDSENDYRPAFYSLYAVNQHFGALDYGHYISYRRLMLDNESGEQLRDKMEKYELPGQWIIADDETLYTVDEDFVKKAQAYILFYKRIF